MTWLVVFEHPDPREVDDRGDRHVRRVQAAAGGREEAIHLGWRQNARIALEQGRPLYEFVSAVELDEQGKPVTDAPAPRRRWPWAR